ncbi:MAG: hypothetical protein Q9178_002365 [Gyalolechia marmorata]
MACTSQVIDSITFDCYSTMSHNPKLETFKAADFAYFGATWWPHASYDRLKVVTFLAIWVEIVGTARLPDVPRQPTNASGPQARGSIGSMIPLEYVQSRNARAAVDKTALLLAKTIEAFKHTAQQLLQRSAEKLNVGQARAVGDIVKGCQFYCTGNLAWRYSHP